MSQSPVKPMNGTMSDDRIYMNAEATVSIYFECDASSAKQALRKARDAWHIEWICDEVDGDPTNMSAEEIGEAHGE